MPDKNSPATPSSDFSAQIHFWEMVDAILCGAPAMRTSGREMEAVAGPATPYAHLDQLRQRSAYWNESPYLPRFPNESPTDYKLRREHAPLTNVYTDISGNLGSKPFSKELQLDEGSPSDLEDLAKNIDGQGRSLHVFARESFKVSIDKGISWILIDYTKVPTGATLADERSMGARPYWVHVPPERLVAVYSDFIAGQQLFTHARIHEPVTVRNGYGEERRDRVRVFNREPIVNEATAQVVGYLPAIWELWEYRENEDKGVPNKEYDPWVLIDGGPVTVGVIPLVPIMSGKRHGTTWQVDAPLSQLAYLQVEEFQQESNLKTIKELTAFPMLVGSGVDPGVDASGVAMTVPVGPRTTLFAPPGGGATGRFGDWHFIEPNAASLTFLQTDLEKLRTEMRDLGMQPLATANLTVVTTANVAMRAHNAVQAWALLLKDALEQAWKITAMWLGRDEQPQVKVHTDFGVDIQADTELTVLAEMATAGKLSDRSLWDEMKRRGVLSDDFDPDEEEKLLAEQQQGLAPEQQIDPRTGKPLTSAPGQPPRPANAPLN